MADRRRYRASCNSFSMEPLSITKASFYGLQKETIGDGWILARKEYMSIEAVIDYLHGQMYDPNLGLLASRFLSHLGTQRLPCFHMISL